MSAVTTPRPAHPYDTGEVLEPTAWSAAPDQYGMVDFDSDESGTLATVQIVRNPALGRSTTPYIIRIAGNPADFEIEWID